MPISIYIGMAVALSTRRERNSCLIIKLESECLMHSLGHIVNSLPTQVDNAPAFELCITY